MRRASLATWVAVAVLVARLATPDAHAQATPAPELTDTHTVHCLFPGQVRRLGAFSTSVTPRRAARVSPAACRAGGGEYVEPGDALEAARRIWLPLAADGVPEAQSTVGELYDQQGQAGLARAWYEKAAAQGSARAQFNLAALLQRSGAAGQGDRVAELLAAATGGMVTGLVLGRAEPPTVDFVAPQAALRLPRLAQQTVTLASAGRQTVLARVHAPAGVAQLLVNGAPAKPAEDGLLHAEVEVADEPVAVAVSVRDRLGQEAHASVSLLHRSAPLAAAEAAQPSVSAPEVLVAAAATPVAAAPLPLPTGRRHALVVANQRYRHWPALDTPEADGRAVAAVLQSRFGYQVTLLQDASRPQMLQALARLRQQVGPEDQVVVYYAGHGQMDEATARGYWIPVDGAEKDVSQWVSVIDVTDQLAAMPARHVLVIADSCYAGTLMRSLMPRIDAALTADQRQAPLAHLSRQRVRVALTSGGLEPVVDGGSIEHSLFARSLLDALRAVEGPVAGQELFAAVSARFSHLASRLRLTQQPQFAPIGFAGHEAGDFVIAPASL